MANIIPSSSVGFRRVETDNPLSNFATATTEQLALATFERAQTEVDPVVPLQCPLINKMGNMFAISELGAANVDTTGRSAKLSFGAKVDINISGDAFGANVKVDKNFARKTYLTVGVPNSSTVSCLSGTCPVYGNAVCCDSAWLAEAGYNDRKSAVEFYNRQGIRECSRYTAAAMEMAHYYVEAILLPRLGRNRCVVLPGVEEKGRYEMPSSFHTTFMPSELISRHSAGALCLAYHAMEANNTLTAANYVIRERVWNGCGELPEIEIDEQTFWEGFSIVNNSSGGAKGDKMFEATFLQVVAQNFPLHGYCDEGGIWRSLLTRPPVSPNCGLILSNSHRAAIGYANVPCVKVLGAAITYQTLISRALMESNLGVSLFMTHEDPGPAAVNEAISCGVEAIKQSMAEGIDIRIDFVQTMISLPSVNEFLGDRHINKESAGYYKQYSAFWPSYATNCGGNYYGRSEYDKESTAPLCFSGEYETKLYSLDNELFASLDMCQPRRFTDGLTYLSHRFNPDDGAARSVFAGASLGAQEAISDSLRLVDGTVINTGSTLGSRMWRENGDFMPCPGELITRDKAMCYVTASEVPQWARHGSYSVCLSRYTAVPAPNCGKGVVASSWYTDLTKHYTVKPDTDFSRKGHQVGPIEYLTKHKRQFTIYGRKKAEQLLLKEENVRMRYLRSFKSVPMLDLALAELRKRNKFDDETIRLVSNKYNVKLDDLKNTITSEENLKESAMNLILTQVAPITNALNYKIKITTELNSFARSAGELGLLSIKRKVAKLKSTSVLREQQFALVDKEALDKASASLKESKVAAGEKVGESVVPILQYGSTMSPRQWSASVYARELRFHCVLAEHVIRERIDNIAQFIELSYGRELREEFEFMVSTGESELVAESMRAQAERDGESIMTEMGNLLWTGPKLLTQRTSSGPDTTSQITTSKEQGDVSTYEHLRPPARTPINYSGLTSLLSTTEKGRKVLTKYSSSGSVIPPALKQLMLQTEVGSASVALDQFSEDGTRFEWGGKISKAKPLAKGSDTNDDEGTDKLLKASVNEESQDGKDSVKSPVKPDDDDSNSNKTHGGNKSEEAVDVTGKGQ